MRKLTGNEAINYLLSLKKYEFQTACRFPIGQRVRYYKIQTEWINEELKKAKEEI